MEQLSLGGTEAVRFLDDARQAEVRLFFILICLYDATRFVLLSVFTRIQTIWTKIYGQVRRPRTQNVLFRMTYVS